LVGGGAKMKSAAAFGGACELVFESKENINVGSQRAGSIFMSLKVLKLFRAVINELGVFLNEDDFIDS
jgi:hypothetical protein